MKPSTSTIATGSFMPDSPSRIRARRFFSDDPRSTEKIAALSVAATIEPSSRPSSVLRSSSQRGGQPDDHGLGDRWRTMASITLVRSTGRISPQPDGQAALEQDEHQRDHADRARQLHVLGAAAEVDQAEPVGADQPSPGPAPRSGRARAGARPPATRLCPVASSAPASSRSCPYSIGPGSSRSRPARPGPRGRATRGRAPSSGSGSGSRWRLIHAVCMPSSLRHPDVVLEAERHVQHLLRAPGPACPASRVNGRRSGL